MGNMADFFKEEEDRLLVETKKQIAVEDAQWKALSPEEKQKITDENEAKWASYEEVDEQDDDDDDDDEDEE